MNNNNTKKTSNKNKSNSFVISIFNEIVELFKAIYNGAIIILQYVFVEFPYMFYSFLSKYIYKVYLKAKNYSDKQKRELEASGDSGKTLIQIARKKLNDWYDNLPYVKRDREKKEASLKVLSIDPKSKDVIRTSEKQTYKYLARNKEGKLETGFFSAQSKLDVYSYLIDREMTVYEITTSWAINFFHTESSSIKRKMKNKDLVFWLAQLSTYIKAGIPLTDSVKILASQDKRKRYKGVYEALIYELTMGETFSKALEKQGNVFPPLLVNMVKSAEMVGDIESTLDEMSDYYQEIEDTKKAVISALTYPSMVFVFAIGIVKFMLVYIVPKFVAVYDSMQADLPGVTKLTLKISDYMQTQYMSIIGIVALIVTVYILLYRKVKLFKATMQKLFMKLPVVGNLIIYKEMSVFARTFATLSKNNVLITDSIDILGKITNNEIYKTIMHRTIKNLLRGEKMSESFKNHWAIPELAYYMMTTGESTGQLAEMLDKIGDYYHKMERNTVNQMKVFIEPIMIIFLALIVGVILIAILIPMFGIYGQVK